MNASPALVARGVGKRFVVKETGQRVEALADLSLEVPAGGLTALVGPDGAGKTTLLRLAAGLIGADAGALEVLGIDVSRDPQAVQDRISYMPQRFGLYEDLSVQENLDLYADLHGVGDAERRSRFARLLDMTGLAPFGARLAGKLSGGMKQKLGLACALVRTPALLLLDEPTVGVDPLSRRELWSLLEQLAGEQRITVLVSTTYLDEAARCAHVAVLHGGRLLMQGPPQAISAHATGLCFIATPVGEPARALQARIIDDPQSIDAVPRGSEVHFIRQPAAIERGDPGLAALLGRAAVRPGAASVEAGFLVLLRGVVERKATVAPGATQAPAVPAPPAATGEPEAIIEVRDLTRRFGDFVAVDHTTFSVRRGEIFGLLGPNGAGKTTTFRMLCGLLPASSGFLQVAGHNLRTARAEARREIGYVSQKFALYGNLSIDENLAFFGGAYGLHGAELRERRAAVMAQFELEGRGPERAGNLPGGYRQRLAMAAALLHAPQILFLDEPTSGADPFARRDFWRRIAQLAAQDTTVIVTTHFMEEAEYCDRVVIQDAGRVLALGRPEEIRREAGETPGHALDMEQSFIEIVARARREGAGRAAA
ncbi:MAG: ATP-binding cassette domain-containing protein [Steroidobacteraceae bacterium]